MAVNIRPLHDRVLVGGVAVIKVGADTETEMKEKKARVEDAMHATKAALLNAASIAGLMFTTEALVSEIKEKEGGYGGGGNGRRHGRHGLMSLLCSARQGRELGES